MITRYQVEATNGKQSFTIGFTPRVSRIGLLKMMQSQGQQLIDAIGITDDDQITFACKPRVHAKVKDWTIGFTGRTQHDYIVEFKKS